MSRINKRQQARKNRIIRNKIIFLIIFLIIVIFFYNKRLENKNQNNDSNKIEESTQTELLESMQIYYSLSRTEDKTKVKISFTIKSDVGIKKVELPDRTIKEYNNEKEVKFDYIVEKNGEYIIKGTDADDNVTQKNINITAISQ